MQQSFSANAAVVTKEKLVAFEQVRFRAMSSLENSKCQDVSASNRQYRDRI